MNNQPQQAYELGEVRNESISESDNFSVERVTIRGNNAEVQYTESNAVFVVEEGFGRFVIGGVPRLVQKGDVVHISKGIPFSNQGEMTLLAYYFPRLNNKNIVLYPLKLEDEA